MRICLRTRRVLGILLLLSSFSVSKAVARSKSSSSTNIATSLITQPVDETKLTVLKGNTHPLARPQFDQGAAPLGLPLNRMLLVLKRSDAQERALRKLLDDQQDKTSPSYHKWLTPEDFGKQFGPSDQDIQTVTTWLQSHGFQIGQVAKGKNIIEFSGTAAQVREALHTQIHKYVVKGEQHWANANDPAIPAALAPVVSGVLSLHNFAKKPQLHLSKQPIAAVFKPGSKSAVTFPSTPAMYALGPPDYATIYNINPAYQAGITGAGTTVAVVGRSDLYQGGTDVSEFDCTVFGQCVNFTTILNGPDPGDLGGGEEGEATLDVTWSGAIAPGAFIDFVVSASTNTTDGVDLSELYIIDNNLADVMTESFGNCELGATQSQAAGTLSLAEQAAAQGITYFVSSGDSGAEGCDDPDSETVAQFPVSVNLLASTPYTIAVGGTMFNENGQDAKYWGTNQPVEETALSYIPEDVWNESCTASQCGSSAGIWAGGGGASAIFPKPSWQIGMTPNDSARDVPDVSLTAASHDPYLLCLEGSCESGYIYFVSGTSASSPSFAGIMALVDQQAGSRQGDAHSELYRLAATETLSQCNASNTSTLPASSCTFNDVTSGNNAVPGEPNYGSSAAQYQAATGYDLATGLGSVNVANLVNNWNSVTATRPTVAALLFSQTTNITHGSPVNFTVTVTPASGTGTASGNIALIATLQNSQQQGLGFFPLLNGSVSASTTLLPGGTNNITAHYAGDQTFEASDSSATEVTVGKEGSVTVASLLNSQLSSFTSAPYGTFAYLRADVHGSSGQGTPTGSVDFIDSLSGYIGSYALNSQGNSATPSGYFNFVPGTHSFSADYQGDSSFSASNSTGVPFTITQGPTTVTVTSMGNAQGATITATVNTAGSGGNPPSGLVSFTLNGKPFGTSTSLSGTNAVINPQSGAVTTAAFSAASYTDAQLANGQYSVSASYTGDTNYAASTGSASITVQPDFALSESNTVLGINTPGSSTSMAITIAAEDGFNGAVSFSCSGLPSESTCSFSPATVTANGTTTLSISSTAATTALLAPENHNHFGWWLSSSGAVFAGIFLIGGSKTRRRWPPTSLLTVLALLLMLPACGGGSSTGGGGSGTQSNPGTPTGNSTVTITATSGAIAHTTSFTLVVQ